LLDGNYRRPVDPSLTAQEAPQPGPRSSRRSQGERPDSRLTGSIGRACASTSLRTRAISIPSGDGSRPGGSQGGPGPASEIVSDRTTRVSSRRCDDHAHDLAAGGQVVSDVGDRPRRRGLPCGRHDRHLVDADANTHRSGSGGSHRTETIGRPNAIAFRSGKSHSTKALHRRRPMRQHARVAKTKLTLEAAVGDCLGRHTGATSADPRMLHPLQSATRCDQGL